MTRPTYACSALVALIAVIVAAVGCGDESNPADPTDTTPPASITDLAIAGATEQSVTLTWTAPGDDGMQGTADGYDLRYAVDSLATWGAMTRFTATPEPRGAGNEETVAIIGLSPGTTYTFELRVIDEAGNGSGASNRPRAATVSIPDVIAPGRVTSLAPKPLGYTTSTTLTLQWSAPGDDGYGGEAPSSYDLRFATSSSTPWELMTEAMGEPPPQPYGATETMEVGGLVPSTTYYFRLRAADEAPNWSEISNVATGSTLAPGEICGWTNGDTRWTLAGSPYRLICDVGASSGTLTIEPGVEIVVEHTLRIELSATLLADGTAAAPILFTGSEEIIFRGVQGSWANDSTWASGSLLRHCTIEVALDCTTVPAFLDCTLRGGGQRLLWVRGDDIPEVRLLRCIVEDHVGAFSAIDLVARRALILLNCTLRNNNGESVAGGALTVAGGGWCTIRGCTFTDNSSDLGAAIGILGVTSFRLSCSEFSGNEGGIWIYAPAQDDAFITVEDTNLSNAGWEVYNQSLNTLDLADNWWGTTDGLAVHARIHDCQDVVDGSGCAEIQPLRPGPVDIGACSP